MYCQSPIFNLSDLVKIQEIYENIVIEYPAISTRRRHILATCQYFSSECEEFDINIPLKLRPYCGLIGIDDSSLDSYLHDFKILRLHAVIPDAAGYMYENFQRGPGYSYMLPCRFKSCFAGHASGIAFFVYIKLFQSKIYHFV